MPASATIGANGRTAEDVPPPADPDAYTYGDLLTLDLPPARRLIDGLVDEGTGNIWGGAPNVGKTWLTLTAARSVAAGAPWLGHLPTAQGTVLVVDEESHLAGLQARVRMLEAAEPLGPDLPLLFAVGRGLRLDAASAAELDRLLGRYRPALVVLDSMTRVHGADENSAGQMADVFGNAKALMRRHGAAFLFTDHVRKKGLINDPDEVLRGSTEKRAWPDSILAVEADERDRGALVVRHTKARHGRRLDPFGVSLEIDEAAGTARLVHAGAVRTDQATKGHDVVQAIHALKAQLGPDGADATTVAAWLACHPDTVRRHVAKLVAAGIVATRKAAPGERGGKPKDFYDVTGDAE